MVTSSNPRDRTAGENKGSSPVAFKRCRYCGKEWPGRDEFVQDPDVFLAGKRASTMMPFIASVSQGLLLFVHRAHNCGSTLLVAPEALIENVQLRQNRP